MTCSRLSVSTDSFEGLLLCCPAPSPRSQAPSLVAAAAQGLGVPPENIEVMDSVTEAVSTALLATSEDGQIVVTGSLYVVGAARAVLVDDPSK